MTRQQHPLAKAKVRHAMADWTAALTSTHKTGYGRVTVSLVGGQQGLPYWVRALPDSMRAGTRGRPCWARLQYLMACM